jgi:FAD/FMN-containing dehydrogenase
LISGTCPTVGISGHVMGGGYGLLARAYGLACDP